MSRYLNYVFPAGNTQDVCLTQTLAGAGNLALNGNLANSIHSQVSFIERGYSRNVSLTSANDLSARQFTITGTQNGVHITENIVGPNANTVYSVESYDVIQSILVDGAAAAVSIGTGHSGFVVVDVNLEKDVINCALSVSNPNATINTTLFGTYNDLSATKRTYADLVSSDFTLFSINDESTDTYNASNSEGASVPIQLYKSLLVLIVGTNATIAQTIQVIFRQT